MLHPALARAIVTAHVEDQLRAAARWQTIRRAPRLARESRVAATSPSVLVGIRMHADCENAALSPPDVGDAIPAHAVEGRALPSP
jgi:hypothetical protein